jgi:Fic family protein
MKTFKSGIYIQEKYHKSFHPNFINRQWEIDQSIITLLSEANFCLGQLSTFSGLVDIELFIMMHTAKEATESSKIEGTQTKIEEVFIKEENIGDEKRNDWIEIHNYIDAMNFAIQSLEKYPFSSKLLKLTHKILLSKGRGEHKLPGEYRTSQNWIGGASIKDATFVPPPHNLVPELISDIENFVHNNKFDIPELIKIAIIHYQFETIHPFLDGNGRVGRLMIPLYLVSQDVLSKPLLYLSDFFERNRTLYYDNLTRVRTHNDINQWIKFFLVGVIETAKKGCDTFKGIMKLKTRVDTDLSSYGSRYQNLKTVVDHLFSNPVITVKEVQELIHKEYQTSYKTIKELKDLGILYDFNMDLPRGQKSFYFKDYINLF